MLFPYLEFLSLVRDLTSIGSQSHGTEILYIEHSPICHFDVSNSVRQECR